MASDHRKIYSRRRGQLAGGADISRIRARNHFKRSFLPAELPSKVIIVGGGYIGVEFAGIFHGLGAETTQLYRGESFLRGFDNDIRLTLADRDAQARHRSTLQTRYRPESKSRGDTPRDSEDGSIIKADQILYATGRVPKTRDLGLENAGVELRRSGAVVVDEYLRSSVESIYAIGDCTDRLMLTPVAIAEGMAVANTLFNNRPTQPSYLNVPTAIFSSPNCGTVGLTEAEARAREFKVDIYMSLLSAVATYDDRARMSGR